MAVTVEIQPRNGYLNAIVAGEFDFPSARDAYLRILREAVACRLLKVLIDCRGLEGNPSLTERLDLGKLYTDQRFEALLVGEPTSHQIAFVAPAPLVHPDMPGIALSNQRGGNSMGFEQVEDALNWLGVAPQLSKDSGR